MGMSGNCHQQKGRAGGGRQLSSTDTSSRCGSGSPHLDGMSGILGQSSAILKFELTLCRPADSCNGGLVTSIGTKRIQHGSPISRPSREASADFRASIRGVAGLGKHLKGVMAEPGPVN